MASAPLSHGHGADTSKTVHSELADPYATMGQLSFAPATKTTVVTTTTTTTTTFPPMCINAPGNLGERDPKEYPLAHTQAPESIRKFYFESGGGLACFEEEQAASDKVQEVRVRPRRRGLGIETSRRTADFFIFLANVTTYSRNHYRTTSVMPAVP